MLVLLSPTKTLKTNPHSTPTIALSSPLQLKQAQEIARQLQTYDIADLMKLYKSKEAIAKINYERWQNFGSVSNAAIMTYHGLVYQCLDAASLQDDALDYANRHIRILSGLYGILRPFDAISPYRLEMASKYSINGCANLYQYWNDILYQSLYQTQESVLNLASAEYAKAIVPFLKQHDVFVTCSFMTNKQGKLLVESTASKMARGKMARYIATRQITDCWQLTEYDEDGYCYNASLSSSSTLVFIKTQAT